MGRPRTMPPACTDAIAWLDANGVDLAPLTGQDTAALRAIAHLMRLWSVSDDAGRRAARAAITAAIGAMQPRPEVRLAAVRLFDWIDAPQSLRESVVGC